MRVKVPQIAKGPVFIPQLDLFIPGIGGSIWQRKKISK